MARCCNAHAFRARFLRLKMVGKGRANCHVCSIFVGKGCRTMSDGFRQTPWTPPQGVHRREPPPFELLSPQRAIHTLLPIFSIISFFCNYFDESNACIGFHSKKRFPLSTEWGQRDPKRSTIFFKETRGLTLKLRSTSSSIPKIAGVNKFYSVELNMAWP